MSNRWAPLALGALVLLTAGCGPAARPTAAPSAPPSPSPSPTLSLPDEYALAKRAIPAAEVVPAAGGPTTVTVDKPWTEVTPLYICQAGLASDHSIEAAHARVWTDKDSDAWVGSRSFVYNGKVTAATVISEVRAVAAARCDGYSNGQTTTKFVEVLTLTGPKEDYAYCQRLVSAKGDTSTECVAYLGRQTQGVSMVTTMAVQAADEKVAKDLLLKLAPGLAEQAAKA